MGVTLVVMARAPVAGSCKNRLAPTLGAGGAARLYAAMVRDTLDSLSCVGATGLVVMVAPKDDGVAALRALAPEGWEVMPQEGHDLRARLAHAYRVLGREGDAVLVAGSDSPTAPFSKLANAIHMFRGERRAIIGACDEGGYYLIGLTTIELGILRDVSWTTGDAIAQTRERCRELGLTLLELPRAYEVDLPESVERLRLELAAHPARAPRTAAFLRENPP